MSAARSLEGLAPPRGTARSQGSIMKVRAQIGKVLNLDKCIGCHVLGHLQERLDQPSRNGARVV